MPPKTSKPIDPWSAMDAIIRPTIEPHGDDWFTVADFCKRYGYSHQRAHSILIDMYTAGKLDRWIGTAFVNRRKTIKYRLK